MPISVQEELIRFLHSKLITVLSTVNADGNPESATVFYWVNDIEGSDFNFYIITRRSSRKFLNLQGSPHVSMVVGTEFAPETVQIKGEAQILEAADGIRNLTGLGKLIKAKYSLFRMYGGDLFPKNPFGAIKGVDFAIIKIRPTWVRWMRYSREKDDLEYIQIKG